MNIEGLDECGAGVAGFGIGGVRATWTGWFKGGPVDTAAMLVGDEYWVVTMGEEDEDTPISGPFETKEAVLTALRIINATWTRGT